MTSKSVAALALSLAFATSSNAQDPEQPDPSTSSKRHERARQIDWKHGPCTLKLGDQATIDVPAGFDGTEKAGARAFLEATDNIPTGTEVGVVVKHGAKDGEIGWWVCLEYIDTKGKVPDDEKLDADKLLEHHKEMADDENEERKKRGLEPLRVIDWAVKPHYDTQTHNLEFGLLIEGSGGRGVNYDVDLLGRSGYMKVSLICSPDDLNAAMAEFRSLFATHQFVKGKSYAEWKQGDPVAEIGLTALVMGGAAAAAWKFGLLGKLLKFVKVIVVGVVAVVAAVWKKITGRGRKSATA